MISIFSIFESNLGMNKNISGIITKKY